MIICVECKKEMTCIENGYGVRWYEEHYYPGDLYQCMACGRKVVFTNSTPTVDKKSPGVQMTKEDND